jgi:hypothetical protein
MKKVVFVLAVAIVFVACSGHSRHHSENVPNDSTQVKIDSVIKSPVKELSMEDQFYSELFNKKGLKLGTIWKDSVIVETEGEGTYEYKLPVKVQYGSTEKFLFRIFTSNKYWEETETEQKMIEVQYRLIGTPKEGKTLAEDRKNREMYEWNWVSYSVNDSIESLLLDIQYPKERYVYKK